MKTAFNHTIAIIGSGKVATALATALHAKGIRISEVCSVHLKNSELLAKKIKAKPVKKIGDLTAAIFIIAIKDDAIEKTVAKIKGKDPVLIHTSGTVSIKLLKKKTKNAGVIYPLQTFTGKTKVDLKKVPLLTESSNKKTAKIIQFITQQIGKTIINLSSDQRKKIHLSAVMVANFPNFLYVMAESILRKEKISFAILIPLIEQVTKNLKISPPSQNQTGPAFRKDKKVIAQHLELLENEKDIQGIYRLLSQSISRYPFEKTVQHSKK